MDYEFRQIPLERIDASRGLFCVTFPPDFGRLQESIAREGLLDPPVVRPRGRQYEVLCGFRRFLACRALGFPLLPALVCREPVPDRRAYDLALGHNLSVRTLNDVEIARVLHALEGDLSVSREEVIRHYLPLLGLEPHETIRRRAAALAGLPENLQLLIVEKRLPLQVSSLFLRFPADDRGALFELLNRVPFGVNRLKEILPCLREILGREEITLRDLVREPELSRYLDEESAPAPQRAEKARRYILRRRFPALSRLQEEANRKIRALSLPPSVSLSFPAGGEGGKVRASFEFPSREELDQVVRGLQTLGADPALDDLLLLFSRGAP